MQFVTVQSSAQFAIGRELFREYADALSVDLCFQGFDAELASLEQMYAAPRGRLLFAMVDGEVAGCVAVRALDGENYGPGGWCSDETRISRRTSLCRLGMQGERVSLDTHPHRTGDRLMNNVYKTTEIVGSSTQGVEHAVTTAVERAGKTLRNLRWFEVTEIRGHIEQGAIAHWQVTVKVGFTMDE